MARYTFDYAKLWKTITWPCYLIQISICKKTICNEYEIQLKSKFRTLTAQISIFPAKIDGRATNEKSSKLEIQIESTKFPIFLSSRSFVFLRKPPSSKRWLFTASEDRKLLETVKKEKEKGKEKRKITTDLKVEPGFGIITNRSIRQRKRRVAGWGKKPRS